MQRGWMVVPALLAIGLAGCGTSVGPRIVPSSTFGSTTTSTVGSPLAGRVLVQSVSFTSADQGFVLGQTCTNGPCATIRKTTNRGRSWAPVTSPVVGPLGLNVRIYFADTNDGWLYGGSQTFVTHDGGAHWTTIALAGVEGIAAGGGTTYLIGTTCSNPSNCSGPNALYKSPVGSDAWQVVPDVVPVAREGLSTSGSAVFVGEDSCFVRSLDGSSFAALANPCPATGSIGPYLPGPLSAYLTNDGGVSWKALRIPS